VRDAECIEAYHDGALPYIPRRLKEKLIASYASLR
jgi:hypothetical protein